MKTVICIVCPKGCEMEIEQEGGCILVKGNQCERGQNYAKTECIDPYRSITTTVRTSYQKVPRLPVKGDRELSIKDIFSVMKALECVKVDHPVHTGEIIVENVLGTGVSIIAASDLCDLLELQEMSNI